MSSQKTIEIHKPANQLQESASYFSQGKENKNQTSEK